MKSEIEGIQTGANGIQLPCFFVVGCPRSGTTLLQRILDHHPSLAVGYDTHFIPQSVRRFALDEDPILTPELVARVKGHRRFSRLGLPEETVMEAASASKTFSEFVSRLYGAFAAIHGKTLAGEKSPGYCRHIPRLHALFPNAKIVHLIRDGRDVTLSVLDWGKGQPGRLALWKRSPVATCALWWKWKVGKGILDGRRLGSELYQEARYEELVLEPEDSTRSLAAFLEIPFSSAMVNYHQGRTRQSAGLSAKAAWLPPTPGLRDWRVQMKEDDVELFESLAGDLLSELEYERAFPTISPSVREFSRECRQWWQGEMGEDERKDRKSVHLERRRH